MKKKLKWLAVILILLILGWAGFRIMAKTDQIFTGRGNIFTRVGNLIISPDRKLIGEAQGQVNVLLMGVGGAGHEGSYLTDTMIVAQINTQSHEVVLTSIPRDFAVTLPKYGYNKINAAYAYTYRDDENKAGLAAIDAAEKVTGLSIPYYTVIDFKGFVQAVDDVGGLDITIDHTFTDATFPNDYPYDTKGYLAPVTFTTGPAHMNGKTALIFARSRHSGNNNEGSDFARSERQKKILVAFKNKILSLNLTSLSTINNLLSDFTENFRTNLEPFELKHLADLAGEIDSQNIYSFTLEPDGKLICAGLVDPATGRRAVLPPAPTPTMPPADTVKPPAASEPPAPAAIYVIMPCEGKTLTDIHEFVLQAPLLAKLKKENAMVEIQNSTGKTGLAQATYKKLVELGLDVRFTSFKGKIAYTQTIFYDNSNGKKPNTLDYLKNHYTFVTSDVNYPNSAADFIIIVGKDAL